MRRHEEDRASRRPDKLMQFDLRQEDLLGGVVEQELGLELTLNEPGSRQQPRSRLFGLHFRGPFFCGGKTRGADRRIHGLAAPAEEVSALLLGILRASARSRCVDRRILSHRRGEESLRRHKKSNQMERRLATSARALDRRRPHSPRPSLSLSLSLRGRLSASKATRKLYEPKASPADSKHAWSSEERSLPTAFAKS